METDNASFRARRTSFCGSCTVTDSSLGPARKLIAPLHAIAHVAVDVLKVQKK